MGKLVWLASYPKSGNTWLRAFLHNYLRASDRPHDINRLHEMSIAESEAAHFARFDPRPARDWTVSDVQRMRPAVHRSFTTAYPDLVFVKTHNASLVVHGTPLLTPEVTAGAVYLIRDPRDVAVSYAHHLGRPLDETIAFMADPEAAIGGDGVNVYERLGSWSIHVHFWTRSPNPRLHVLRYEDLQADPARAFGSIIDWLGEAPPPDQLARAVRHSQFQELRDQEVTRGFVERPAGAPAFFRSGRSGGWRETLTAAQAARIERDHGAEMTRLGYL